MHNSQPQNSKRWHNPYSPPQLDRMTGQDARGAMGAAIGGKFSLFLPLLLAMVVYFGLTDMGWAEDAADLQKLETEIAKEKRSQEVLLQQGHALQQEARNLRRQLIEAAGRTQEQEYLIENLNTRLAELREDVAYRKKRLAERSSQLSGTLGALTKLSDESASAFFLFPGTPKQSVHSAMLLKAAVPALRDRALVLRQELDSLARVEADMTQQVADLQTANLQLEDETIELNDLLRRKANLVKRTKADQEAMNKRVAKLVNEAKSLRDLLQELNRVRPQARPEEPSANPDAAGIVAPESIMMEKPSSVRKFPESGGIPFPASGSVVQRYGQDLGFGQSAKGIKIKTRPGAQLIAPHDGQIAFAGLFRDHGLIVIIEHEGGYHTILSGMEESFVGPGQWVLAGEPVGVMAKSKASNLELYVELRRDGMPLNPLSWFRRG